LSHRLLSDLYIRDGGEFLRNNSVALFIVNRLPSMRQWLFFKKTAHPPATVYEPTKTE